MCVCVHRLYLAICILILLSTFPLTSHHTSHLLFTTDPLTHVFLRAYAFVCTHIMYPTTPIATITATASDYLRIKLTMTYQNNNNKKKIGADGNYWIYSGKSYWNRLWHFCEHSRRICATERLFVCHSVWHGLVSTRSTHWRRQNRIIIVVALCDIILEYIASCARLCSPTASP